MPSAERRHTSLGNVQCICMEGRIQSVLLQQNVFEAPWMFGHDRYSFDQTHEVLVCITPKVSWRPPQLDFLVDDVIHHVALWPVIKRLAVMRVCWQSCPEQQPQLHN